MKFNKFMDFLGISHKELFENCVENMVVSTETLLKENLIEIIDHEVDFLRDFLYFSTKFLINFD